MAKFGDASVVPGGDVPPFPKSPEAKNECSQIRLVYKTHVIIKHSNKNINNSIWCIIIIHML